jgi:multidrug resistance protein MdtO
MATASVRIPHAARFTTFFPDFLRKELAPYPGRGTIVARTVISATLTMILIVTFRIPGGAIGALCAFVLSREDLLSTAKSALNFIVVFAIGGLFIPIGARMFAAEPMTHFLWEAASIFLAFFFLRTLKDYAVAVQLGLVTTNILSLWYLPGPAERNVELTLWQVAAASIGALVTLVVEAVFHAASPQDEVIAGLDTRLKAIQERMECYAADTERPVGAESRLAQFAIVGVGALRRYIARSSGDPLNRIRRSTLVSLTGRAVDFAAALSSTVSSLPADLRPRAARLARTIADIRHCLLTKGHPCETAFEPEPSPGTPLLSELESMVSLMPSVFSKDAAVDPEMELLETESKANPLFIDDAFSNPEHLRYVLGGTFAAMLCYVLYVSLDWPSLSTSVTTCVLTGLTNIGASRQKQVLRVAGAVLGGVVFGLGAQIFVLPNIDSIAGFTVLFAVVTAVAAWVGSSSTRLSYAGVQMALAFYLIHLSEFSFQTSLTVARDRTIGVLLGTFMMWLVFERFYPRTAADEMIRIFIRNLRLMAGIMTASPEHTDTAAILKIRRQREQVYRQFGEVGAQSDAVPFETGPARAGDMAARDRIRRWQASLRTFYLLEAPLLQFRLFGAGHDKSDAFTRIEDTFRAACAQSLVQIAGNVEKQLHTKERDTDRPPSLVQLLEDLKEKSGDGFSEREIALLAMSRTIALMLDRFQSEVASQSIYAIE